MRATDASGSESRDGTAAARGARDGAHGRHPLFSLEVGRSPLAVALAMFAVVFALRLAVGDSMASGISLLFSIPILLLTVAYGTLAGIGAATLAMALVFVWVGVRDVDVGVADLVMRAIAFYALPLTLLFARPEAPDEPEAPPRSEPDPTPARAPGTLTKREAEVLGLLAAGHTNAEIANKLVLSVRTVESHRANLQRKLGRPSRPELVRYAFRQGLVPGQRLPF